MEKLWSVTEVFDYLSAVVEVYLYKNIYNCLHKDFQSIEVEGCRWKGGSEALYLKSVFRCYMKLEIGKRIICKAKENKRLK